MVLCDLHVHTVFCDGKNTPEETACAAEALGMKTLGFSGHSHTDFDESYCMTDVAGYRASIARLKEEYKGRLEILCGIEQDLFCSESTDGFDYVIGSMHYFKIDGKYYDVDGSPEILTALAKERFGGDMLSLAELYFEQLKGLADGRRVDIIGHFDLISKFNQAYLMKSEGLLSERGTKLGLSDSLFDEKSPRYERAWKSAADCLLKIGAPFEINTGAMAKGYKSCPYPAFSMIEYIRSKGGKFLLSSDCHKAENLMFRFADYEHLL